MREVRGGMPVGSAPSALTGKRPAGFSIVERQRGEAFRQFAHGRIDIPSGATCERRRPPLCKDAQHARICYHEIPYLSYL